MSNGYSKKYTLTPCETKYSKTKQQNSRRAEIILSDNKNTNWEKLELERGSNSFNEYSSSIEKNIQNSTVNIKESYTKGSIFKKNKELNVYEVDDSEHYTKAKKDRKIKLPIKSKVVDVKVKSSVLKNTTIQSTSFKEDELSKEEILAALDSLSKLKSESDRIVAYLTKRINKKPIDVSVSSDSVTIDIYDNAVHDNDSISVILNNRIIVDHSELKVSKPITFKFKVDNNKNKGNELVIVAENLGSNPPNTAIMFVTEKSGRKQQILLSTDMTHNQVVYFIRVKRE